MRLYTCELTTYMQYRTVHTDVQNALRYIMYRTVHTNVLLRLRTHSFGLLLVCPWLTHDLLVAAFNNKCFMWATRMYSNTTTASMIVAIYDDVDDVAE